MPSPRVRGQLRMPGAAIKGIPNFGTQRTPAERAARFAQSVARAVQRAKQPAEINLPFPKIDGIYTDARTLTAPGADWTSDLDPDERWILEHESGLNPLAKNPTSSAFGSWQGLLSTRQTYAKRLGFDPNTTDPFQQKAMFRAYVADRYKTAAIAKAFWERNRYY